MKKKLLAAVLALMMGFLPTVTSRTVFLWYSNNSLIINFI